jgi:FkbM family methyltransferase
MSDTGIVLAKTKYGEIAVYHNDCYIRDCLVSGFIPDQYTIEQVLAPYVRGAKVILDIGAHVGSHSFAYARINPDVVVYAFEPQKRIFELLERNIKHNGFRNVFAMNKAVGPVDEVAKMAESPSDGPNSGLPVQYGAGDNFNLGGLSVGSDGESVEMCSIDSMNIDCQYIKIDVEGFEAYVLRGLEKTIKRCWPVIMFEQNYKVATGDMKKLYGELENESAKEILQSYGYSIRELGYDNYLATKKVSND